MALKVHLQHWDGPGKEVGAGGAAFQAPSLLLESNFDPRASRDLPSAGRDWRIPGDQTRGNFSPVGRCPFIYSVCLNPLEKGLSPQLWRAQEVTQITAVMRRKWRDNRSSPALLSNLEREENSSLVYIINTEEGVFPRPRCHGCWVIPHMRHAHSFLLNWSTVDLQCCVTFRYIAKWFSTYIYIYTITFRYIY